MNDGFIECPLCSFAAEYWLVEQERDDGTPYFAWECSKEWEHQGYISVVPKDEVVRFLK